MEKAVAREERLATNEDEASFQKQLGLLRELATVVGLWYQYEQISLRGRPEAQAREILEGQNYKLAAHMIIDIKEVLGCLRWEDFGYIKPPGLPATREEITEKLYQEEEMYLRDRLDPLEIFPRVIMPLVKAELIDVESFIVNNGFSLPPWERARWLLSD